MTCNKSDFRNGTRVKATVTGVVQSNYRGGDKVRIERDDDQAVHYFKPEELEVIEPEYKPESIYQDAEGLIWRRTTNRARDARWQFVGPFDATSFLAAGHYAAEDTPKRPLTRLVPESR